MKTQVHNEGPLKKLEVKIEQGVYESLEEMAKHSKMTMDDIVVIALKRYRASHAEMLGRVPSAD